MADHDHETPSDAEVEAAYLEQRKFAEFVVGVAEARGLPIACLVLVGPPGVVIMERVETEEARDLLAACLIQSAEHIAQMEKFGG